MGPLQEDKMSAYVAAQTMKRWNKLKKIARVFHPKSRLETRVTTLMSSVKSWFDISQPSVLQENHHVFSCAELVSRWEDNSRRRRRKSSGRVLTEGWMFRRTASVWASCHVCATRKSRVTKEFPWSAASYNTQCAADVVLNCSFICI